MAKLNQIVAVEKGTKNRVNERLSQVYKTLQKADLFTGHVKRYSPRDEDPTSQFGEQLPDDKRNVQQDVQLLLQQISETQTELLDVTYLRDVTNCAAKADVTVNGKVILKGAPVTYLLWLEKQLNDLHSEIKKVPTLDPAEKWSWDPTQGMYATEASQGARTKKITVPLVLAPATDKHPAQVKEATEDVRMGTWTTIKYSSAMPVDKREAMLKRVEDLHKAVKQAAQAGNMIDVPDADSVGKKIFEFVLG